MTKSLRSRRPLIRRSASTGGQQKAAGALSPLRTLGWKPFFLQQLSLDALTDCEPLRVMAVHRGQLEVSGERGDEVVLVNGPLFEDSEEKPTVGDWLLLERSSLFRRMAPGAKLRRTSTTW